MLMSADRHLYYLLHKNFESYNSPIFISEILNFRLTTLSVLIMPYVVRISKDRYYHEPRCEKTGLRGFRPGSTQKIARGLKFRV